MPHGTPYSQQPDGGSAAIPPCHTGGNKEGKYLPKATQLVGGRARTGSRASQILTSLCLDSLQPKALGHPSPGRGPPERPPARTQRLSASGSERGCPLSLDPPLCPPSG